MGRPKGAMIEETTWCTVLEVRWPGVMVIMSPVVREERGSWTRRWALELNFWEGEKGGLVGDYLVEGGRGEGKIPFANARSILECRFLLLRFFPLARWIRRRRLFGAVRGLLLLLLLLWRLFGLPSLFSGGRMEEDGGGRERVSGWMGGWVEGGFVGLLRL